MERSPAIFFYKATVLFITKHESIGGCMLSRFAFLVIALLFMGQGVSFSADTATNNGEREFCRLDKDNNREISFEEFAACEFYKLESVRALPYAESKDLNKSSKGGLSDDELKAYLFNKADRNKNGMIDRAEWEEFYNSLIEPGGGIPNKHLERR